MLKTAFEVCPRHGHTCSLGEGKGGGGGGGGGAGDAGSAYSMPGTCEGMQLSLCSEAQCNLQIFWLIFLHEGHTNSSTIISDLPSANVLTAWESHENNIAHL